MQSVNVFLCRSETRTALARGAFRNRLMLVGIAIELALVVVISGTAVGQAVFHTAPLDWNVWLLLLPFAAGLLLAEELRKWFVRTTRGRSQQRARCNTTTERGPTARTAPGSR
jgi:magnesium-transporting ATPase (P-type)